MTKIHYQGLPCNPLLTQAHIWGEVTCQKCLQSKKTGDKKTPINRLKKLIKSWPKNLELICDQDTGWITVLEEGVVLAEIYSGNLKMRQKFAWEIKPKS